MSLHSTKPNLMADMTTFSLRTKVKEYKKRILEIQKYLDKHPKEWGKFQNEFNAEVNSVFRNIMNFEKENLTIGCEDKVYKLKKFFLSKVKKIFIHGDFAKWCQEKPYGYSGDFKIIEDIYQNDPLTMGFDRLFDNYFMMSAISIAVRNRKNDFKKMIIDYLKTKRNTPIRIMDLASGPCREIHEMFIENKSLLKNVIFDCYDSDTHALEYAKERLASYKNVNFFSQNAARIAFRKDINGLIEQKYDIIYSTGLFDYFEERIAFRLIQNLRKLLNKNGQLLISDVRDKFSNPSVHYMEWAGDWNLVYRNDEDFKNIFIDAGFNEKEIEIGYEQQGILQYIKAHNRKA